MTRNVQEVADRLVGSYLNTNPDPNLAEIFAPKVLGWHNFDPEKVEYDGPGLAKMLMQRRAEVRQVMPDFQVEDFKAHVAQDAIIFTQVSAGTLADGTPYRCPGCVVWSVENGQIISVNSIRDRAMNIGLEKALHGIGGHGQ